MSVVLQNVIFAKKITLKM